MDRVLLLTLVPIWLVVCALHVREMNRPQIYWLVVLGPVRLEMPKVREDYPVVAQLVASVDTQNRPYVIT